MSHCLRKLWGKVHPHGHTNARQGMGHKGRIIVPISAQRWVHLPAELRQAPLLPLQDYTDSAFCSPHSHLAPGAFRKSVPAVVWGNCSLCEKGRWAQLDGAQSLQVIVRERLDSFFTGGGSRSGQCPEIAAIAPTLTPFNHPHCMSVIASPMAVLDSSMAILFISAVGTVMIGGYWAGLAGAAKPQHTEHQDEEDEEYSDKAIDCTLAMICSAFSIVSMITWCHLAAPSLCSGGFSKMKTGGQDALGVAYCLFMIKSIHMPTMKNCTFYVLAFLVADVLYIFISPFLAQSKGSIMEVAALRPSDSALNEKIPLVLKVLNLNSSPLDLYGFLVTYCHKFDIQVQSSKVYCVACAIAYGIGLLGTFAVRALLQIGQPTLLYLVPCMLITSLLVALWRQELTLFWTGHGLEKNLPHLPLEKAPASYPGLSNNSMHQHPNKRGRARKDRSHPQLKKTAEMNDHKVNPSELCSMPYTEEPTRQTRGDHVRETEQKRAN
uniref:Signal peptide peptidase-like 2B n=1 Tax=Chelydra serpentina TaxID=8475 RepID=A0A8C3XKZ1_CHESE